MNLSSRFNWYSFLFTKAADQLPGGLADTLSLGDIALQHQISVEELQHELNMGIDAELEHVVDRNLAEEIALDHLVEDPHYYTKLRQVGL